MKVAHVITSLNDLAAGPAYSVPGLCSSLEELGVSAPILTLQPFDGPTLPCEVRAYRRSRAFAALGRSPALRRALRAVRATDVVHVHGLWFAPNWYAWRAASGAVSPLVLSPRGMLMASAVGYHSRRKQIAWMAGHRMLVAGAACIHATSESELDDIRVLGYRGAVAIIPNGITVPATPTPQRRNESLRRVLSLGRLHPMKGLDDLLHAWSELEPKHPSWELVIAGPDDGAHGEVLQRLAGQLRLTRVAFTGPVFGEAKDRLYREAEVFVLPTRTESFGLVVAESIAAAVPVVVTQAAPWEELERRGAGWWVPPGRAGVATGLADALSRSPEELRAMGARGRAWASEAFAWPRIAQQMAEVYRWLVQGGTPPAYLDRGSERSRVVTRMSRRGV